MALYAVPIRFITENFIVIIMHLAIELRSLIGKLDSNTSFPIHKGFYIASFVISVILFCINICIFILVLLRTLRKDFKTI